ncbi:hypothetical protein OUZ56_029597 [Daphnia magna]|uniref:Uncharacterized protein n=1 Tax=Daphnia magna TaxID=35525 RepID=A0ABR0B7A6_9CRUS|nr:hypothetical protein OUZ56_029597 [Daphnia magna]
MAYNRKILAQNKNTFDMCRTSTFRLSPAALGTSRQGRNGSQTDVKRSIDVKSLKDVKNLIDVMRYKQMLRVFTVS